MLATDGSGEVVANLQTNLLLNDLDGSKSMDTATFLWGHTLVGGVIDINQENGTYDVVIGADVVSRTSSRNLFMILLLIAVVLSFTPKQRTISLPYLSVS